MCNCKHSTVIEGKSHNGCQIDPSISVGEGWESGYEEPSTILHSSYRTPENNFRNARSLGTPIRGVATVVPNERPLQRSIADTPELAVGVAIVRKQLDFDDSTFDETQGGCGSCRRNQSYRSGMTKPSYSMRNNPSRTTRIPHCEKY